MPKPPVESTKQEQNKNEMHKAREDALEMNIPEAKGDLADQAEIEIEQEIEEQIWRARQNLPPIDRNKKF